jgi:hypothetical protein
VADAIAHGRDRRLALLEGEQLLGDAKPDGARTRLHVLHRRAYRTREAPDVTDHRRERARDGVERVRQDGQLLVGGVRALGEVALAHALRLGEGRRELPRGVAQEAPQHEDGREAEQGARHADVL